MEAVILDFYRASAYLAKLAEALQPTDGASLAQAKSRCRLLRDEGGSWRPTRSRRPSAPFEVLLLGGKALEHVANRLAGTCGTAGQLFGGQLLVADRPRDRVGPI